MQFEWDHHKAVENASKHGVTFYEAASAFGDPLSSTFPDPDHSAREHRYIIVGKSGRGKLLVISHVERGNHIRIISARKATRKEWRFYEEER
jgi:hypothetical protein